MLLEEISLLVSKLLKLSYNSCVSISWLLYVSLLDVMASGTQRQDMIATFMEAALKSTQIQSSS